MTVSIDPEVLRQFDDWRRARALSRGDGVAALLRIAAAGGKAAPVTCGCPPFGSHLVGCHWRQSSAAREEARRGGRVVELEPEEN